MTIGAFLTLEVNLWLPPESNIISMAKATLGVPGQFLAWATYLLLLYSLLAAYIAGGGDFLHHHLLSAMELPNWLSSLLFTSLLSAIVYKGIHSVDYVNRGLMCTKLSAYAALVILILPFVSIVNLSGGRLKYITASITVVITSFGFAIIVPSLRTYFNSDIAQLRRAIIIGSLIPLFCYLLWTLAIMGSIPREGSNGLEAMLQSGRSTSNFVNALSVILQHKTITVIAQIFTSICLATSFLGVALCLSDFLSDGFGIKKAGKGKIIISIATFLPPLMITLFFPGMFISALSCAGIYCVILQVILPPLMVWRGRYLLKLTHAGSYQMIGGKLLLVLSTIIGIVILAKDFIKIQH
jgi:tyrosine-specific transport protein